MPRWNFPGGIVCQWKDLALGRGQAMRDGEIDHQRGLHGRRKSGGELDEGDNFTAGQRPAATDGALAGWRDQYHRAVCGCSPRGGGSALLQ